MNIPGMKIQRRVLMLLIRGYQLAFSSVMAPHCRYHPTCSAYALEAVEGHGALVGTWLALKRITRCHPWGGMGHDPVPAPLAGADGARDQG